MSNKISVSKTKAGYTPRVTIFCGGNETKNTKFLNDAKQVVEKIVKSGYGINTGAGITGLMGVVARETLSLGGDIYGIALSSRDSEPTLNFTNWEGYSSHSDRQKRLLELGDAYIALPGAIGTFHEILEVHILNVLGECNKPIVLVGEYFENYKKLINSFKKVKLMHKDNTHLFYAQNGAEAAEIIINYFDCLVKKNFYPEIFYPALNSNEIYEHIMQNTQNYKILFENLTMTVFPGVYPSNRFRSSKSFAKLVRSLSRNKNVLDMACGHGAMGMVALDAKASEVVMSDVNKKAVKNAKYNLENSKKSDKGIVFESNLFENIPSIYEKHFDIIFFNPPFHNEKIKKTDSSLAYAFKTEENEESVLVRFLRHAKKYLSENGVIYIGFSNKDPDALKILEKTLVEYNYKFKITRLENSETIADTRIYVIKA